MDIVVVRYSHPDAIKLTEQVQQEYVERYGGGDQTPMDPTQFERPNGVFLVGYLDGVPVAMGGWRARDCDDIGIQDGDAELKRMFVGVQWRGQGHARLLLTALEDSARAAGRRRMVLETGLKQPEAIALYRSRGYTDITKFGLYRNGPLNVCLGLEL